MKNVCIVGYGAIGPVHAKALENVENARLYAVCDTDSAKRKLCTEKYEVKEYDNFDQMLLNENIHSVHICTPHYLHFDMVKKALKAGKDVVLEKPVTRTREEFDTLLQLEGADRICVVLQNRLNPCIQKLRSMVQSKELGAVQGVKGILTWSRNEAYYRSGDWRGKWDTEGGCLLINQAIHTLDFFQYVIGDIISVKADMFNYSLEHVIEAEDTLSAYLEFENGIKGIFFATNTYVRDSDPHFEVVFEKGTVRYMDKQLRLNGELLAEDTAPVIGKSYWGRGHAGLIKRYYDEQKYFTVYDARNTMETVFDMYQSASTGASEVRPVSKRHDRIAEITSYIREHLSEDLSINSLAERFYISPSYLSVIFKNETGTTINKYVTAQRVALAKIRLSEGCSVAETCEQCGFRDYSNFLKVFSRSVGVSPKKFMQIQK